MRCHLAFDKRQIGICAESAGCRWRFRGQQPHIVWLIARWRLYGVARGHPDLKRRQITASPTTVKNKAEGSGTGAPPAGMDCCQLSANSFKSAESTTPSALKSPADQAATSSSFRQFRARLFKSVASAPTVGATDCRSQATECHICTREAGLMTANRATGDFVLSGHARLSKHNNLIFCRSC